jgi:hypothetical protein
MMSPADSKIVVLGGAAEFFDGSRVESPREAKGRFLGSEA